jgi:uncharacterized protein YbjT (DUF2867 family)
MHETILITGATGTVGTQLVKTLSNLNVKVRAGVHSLIKGEKLKLPHVELCEIEYHKPGSLTAAFTGVDRVFMITPFTPQLVKDGKIIIDAAKAAGVNHLVCLSASGADADPGIQLGRWHREVEKYLQDSGLNYTILRPTSFMQNFVNYFSDSIKDENVIYLPLGDGKVSFVDVRDIAEIACHVLTTDKYFGQALEITGPEAISCQDIAQAISGATGRDVTYVDVPEDGARQAMKDAHTPDWMIDALMELHGLCKAGYAGNITETTQDVTGHKGHTIQEFAHQYSECFLPGSV